LEFFIDLILWDSL